MSHGAQLGPYFIKSLVIAGCKTGYDCLCHANIIKSCDLIGDLQSVRSCERQNIRFSLLIAEGVWSFKTTLVRTFHFLTTNTYIYTVALLDNVAMQGFILCVLTVLL